ncbi:MAG: hypothetical protein NDI84_05910 [Steroidobacteraceae bacterium]|nr:hypothetical protein [Steroidobacteraceae bacterium]
MTEKPRGKTPQPPAAGSEPGRLGTDDRGNVTWEWQDEGDLLADDTLGGAERIRALVDPSLQVKDDDDDPQNPMRSNPKGLKSGYNPYNSGALGKQSWKKKKNLKELSKWIELRKKMEQKKDE